MSSVHPSGVQRASSGQRRLAPLMVALLAALLAVGGLASQPMPVAAATAKVVIVVGPTGSQTAKYIDSARRLAAQARGYGAAVYEIYSPNATWSRVRSVAQGANLFIYLGHGNGWPSPYCCFQPYTKDGLGLNKVAGAGHSNVRYYGEYYLKNYIRLAPDSVVILNRLCYASGNSEWGTADPSLSTARKRVDNYGAGFLRTGARAVFAEAIASTSYVLYGLFRTSRSVSQIFWSAPNAKRTYASSFSSVRTPGKRALLDPTYRTKYWRSVIGDLGMTASTWR